MSIQPSDTSFTFWFYFEHMLYYVTYIPAVRQRPLDAINCKLKSTTLRCNDILEQARIL